MHYRCRWGLVVLPVGSVGGGGEPAEGLVWRIGVVLVLPILEDGAGFGDIGEVLGVEALVAEPAVNRTPRRGLQGDPGSMQAVAMSCT